MSQPDFLPDSWTTAVAGRPLAFAQVREDPRVDLEIVHTLPAGSTVVMIASGGDTAARLVCAPLRRLHLVDANPAQLALAQLKLHWLRSYSPDRRRQLLGHQPAPDPGRKPTLLSALEALDLPPDVFGPIDWVSDKGPDHAGRYEGLFEQLVRQLTPQAGAIQELLQLRNPAEQSSRIKAGTPLRLSISEALQHVMRMPNLVRLFGEEATRNPARSFASHFEERIEHAFSQFPACCNPFLWQMLRGQFPAKDPYDWLKDAPPPEFPEIEFHRGLMGEVLDGMEAGSAGMVHLSNILDWLDPAAAAATLQSAWRVLKPGGCVLLRQLNSTLDIPGLPVGFRWDPLEGRRLLAIDRSFFYRAIHLGRKT